MGHGGGACGGQAVSEDEHERGEVAGRMRCAARVAASAREWCARARAAACGGAGQRAERMR
jgi:hypothetical protein